MSTLLEQLNNFVKFAVMLLMLVAVVAGQGGTVPGSAVTTGARQVTAISGDYVAVGDAGEWRDTMLRMSMDASSDLKYFRGEDE